MKALAMLSLNCISRHILLAIALTSLIAQANDGNTTYLPVERELEAQLKRLQKLVKSAKRTETVVYGNTGTRAITAPLCSRLFDALKAEKAALPAPIAMLNEPADEEPYFRLVSGLALKYADEQEGRLMAKQETAEGAELMRRNFRKELGWYFLNPGKYGTGRHGKDAWQFRLYENGRTPDGRTRYLQLNIWTHEMLIMTAEVYDLSPDRGFGYQGRYGPADGTQDEYVAYGIVGIEGHVLPWKMLLPTELTVPIQWRHEKWRYVADVLFDAGGDIGTSMICSILIQ